MGVVAVVEVGVGANAADATIPGPGRFRALVRARFSGPGPDGGSCDASLLLWLTPAATKPFIGGLSRAAFQASLAAVRGGSRARRKDAPARRKDAPARRKDAPARQKDAPARERAPERPPP